MLFELRPGAKIETLTLDELERALDRFRTNVEISSPLDLPGIYGGDPARWTTTGAGLLVQPFYTVPAGFMAELYLFSVSIPYASGTPAAQAAGSIYVWKNEAPQNGGSMAGLLAVGSGLPNVLTYSGRSGPRLRSGETYVLELRGAPATMLVGGAFQVRLTPTPPKRASSFVPRHHEEPRVLEKVVA